MALTGEQAYALSKKYTSDSIAGAGAVAGKPCQIDSVTPITGGNRVTFLWEDNAGTSHTSTMDVMDGANGADGAKGDKGDTGDTGKGIKAVTVNAEDHLIVTYTDDTTTDAGQIQITAAVDSVNGKTGTVVLTASDVGALPSDTAIPSKTSDLDNDNNFVADASYVHTDNNYDTTAKNIVDGVTSALADKVDKVSGKGLSENDYTDADKAEVAKVADKADAEDVIDGASYDNTNHLILFKNGTTTLFSLDAAAFVKDGMVDDVEISGGNLVITFNTDAGKQDISIPLTDIFNPANYYDKTATDNLLADKADDTSVYKTFSFGNTGSGGGTVKYIELTGAYPNNAAKENSYMITGRNGESAILVLPTGMTIGVYNDPRLLYLTRGTSTPIVSVNLDSTNGKVYVGIGSYTYIHISQIGGERTNWSGEIITELPSGATTVAIVSDVANKADKVTSATAGNFAGLGANGNLTDSGKKAADFATPGDVETSASAQGALLRDTVGWTGKNLLPYPYITTTKTSGGMTYTENGDGSVTANADSATSSTSSFIFYRFRESTLPKGKYIVTDEGASETNVYLALNKENDNGEYVADLTRLGFNGLHEVEFTVDYDGYTQLSVMIYARSGVTADNLKFYPMIRKANIADSTYEPYHESVETMYEEEIHGINLFNAEPFTKTNNDITITVADNIVTLNGTPSANGGFTLRDFRSSDLVDGETYIISDSNASNYSNCYIYINGEKYDGSTVYDVVRLQTKATLKTDFSTYRRYLIGVYIRTEAGTLSNKKFNIMIRKADIEDSTYRPYNEQAIQNQINVQGVLGTKNLLPQVEHANTTMTINGVTITSREDGSVLLNGTSTAAVSYHFIRLLSDTNRKFIKQVAGKKVTISGTNVLNTNARVQFWSTTTNVIGDTTGNGTTFTIPSDLATTDDYNFAIWIPSGVTINNIIVYPMLRLASDPDDTYQPYAMTNRELTEKVFEKKTLTSADDLNNITETGIYGITTQPSNSPVSYATLIVNKRSDGGISQLIQQSSSIHTRAYGGEPSVWTSWYKFTGTVVS